MKTDYWKKFEETGRINDYLDYVRVKSDWQMDKEGANQNESGNGDRNGLIGDHFAVRLIRESADFLPAFNLFNEILNTTQINEFATEGSIDMVGEVYCQLLN